MKISFLGGALEVGASCILVKIDDKNVLLDCGIRQSSSKDPLPDLRTIQEAGGIDAIVISHAHMDHIGALPIVSKEYPNARIYMNNMTKDLVRVLLFDSLKVMNNREMEIPLYAEKDVLNMLDRIFTINYQVEFEILKDIKLVFYNAGHIAGASCIYLTGKEGALFYSGDFSIFPQNTVEGTKIPKLRPDIAIIESTYGDKIHSNRQVEEEKLISKVKECVDENGKMIIPAFALGRAQEIQLILKKAINKGIIKKANIYIDGMIKDINRTYKRNPLYLKGFLSKKILKGTEPFLDDNIKEISNNEEREAVLKSKENAVIISSSGMLTGGPSQFYAEKIAQMENGYILITGYQDEEAPGRKLLNLLECKEEDRVLQINDRIIPVKCKIDKVGLSAHGDKTEIKSIISMLNPKNIFFVHGEEGVINSIGKEVMVEFRKKVYIPKSGESFNIEIDKPRKQFIKQLKFIINQKETLTEQNIEKLWSFMLENYGTKLFTVEEMLDIWYGDNKQIDETQNYYQLFLDSPYFENDLRRAFMFKPQNKEDVLEALKPKELKQNDISEIGERYFSIYKYKKLGIIIEEKKAILYFDFPKALDESIVKSLKGFEEETGWSIEINDTTNNNAAEIIIRSLIPKESINKISCYLNQEKYVVIVTESIKDKEKLQEEFKKLTGLSMEIQEKGEKTTKDSQTMFSSGNNNLMEQNKALAYIEEAFDGEEFKPYKKSIKGKGIFEIAFISPKVGERYLHKLRDISESTGWKVVLSDTINQNAIMSEAVNICNSKGVELYKNPSFNPINYKVTLKVEQDRLKDEKLMNEISQEFNYKTGCELEFKIV